MPEKFEHKKDELNPSEALAEQYGLARFRRRLMAIAEAIQAHIDRDEFRDPSELKKEALENYITSLQDEINGLREDLDQI